MALASSTEQVREMTTAVITGTVQDDSGTALPVADIDAMLLTLYDKATGDVINNRLLQDVKNANNVTIDAAGALVYTMQPADNVIVGSPAVGEAEGHVAHFVWGWDATSSGTLSNAISTAASSNTVTVAHTGHGLSVGDHVMIKGANDVGGVNPNGLRIVATVPGANSWTFEHPNAATSTEAAGGGSTINYYLGTKVGRQDVAIKVMQMLKAPGG